MRTRIFCLLVAIIVALGLLVSPASVEAQQSGADSWVKVYGEGMRYAMERAWLTRNVAPARIIQSSLDAMALFSANTPPRASGDKEKDVLAALDYFRKWLPANEGERGRFFRTALGALVRPWDEYAAVWDPGEMLLVMFMSGYFDAGDGIVGSWSDEKQIYVVTHVFPGMGGDKAGIRNGDEIIAIAGLEISGLTEAQLYKIDRDALRTGKLVYRIRRDGQVFDVEAEQMMPEAPSISYEMRQGFVGYIRVPSVQVFGGYEVVDAVAVLLAKGAKAIVLDLRKNPGGHPVPMRIMISIFKQGDLYMKRTKAENVMLKNYPVEHVFDGPLAILVDRDSASAPEVITMALKTRPKTRIFGDNTDRTYGKGIGQSGFRLSNGWYIYFTTSEIADLSGISYHGKGVIVDEAVMYGEGALGDPSFQRALTWLTGQK